MPNPRLAARYAKSLMDLSLEKNQLEAVYNDMLFLQAVCKQNPDFTALLKSPVIQPSKKDVIVKAVTNGKIGEITAAFNHLLIMKGRESNLPEIIVAFIDQYKQYKNIYTIKLTTATPVSEELKKAIVSKVQQQTAMQNIDLTTAVKEELVGGFVLEMGGTLVDASIAYDLNKIRAQFMKNDFVYNVR